MNARNDVLIVGGGVIGLASGIALLQAGRSVRVLEAATAGSGSSHGNCGTITPSHAAPLAAPGAVAKALRWMLMPDAPFRVSPRVDPVLWRWMIGFARHCNRPDWLRAMHARSTILEASRAAFPDWLDALGIDCEFEASGVDYVYRDRADFDAFEDEATQLRALGVAVERIDGADYLRQEPALREGVVGAIRFPGDARLRPDRYVAGLAQAFRALGGELVEHCEVRSIEDTGDGVRVDTSQGVLTGRDLLLATGAWSPLLAKSLRLRVPVQPGKGYSITYSRPSIVPRMPMVLHERSVCVTVWDSGFRLGSTMEFSGYDRSLNRVRLDALERAAREYLREPVGPVREEEWYGWRPVSVDDVPILGLAPGHRHLWLATGHGMLGVSMSVATGQLMSDLICGHAPRFDPAPYAPARFA
ncbi:FAD-dependent oxidoreductase [Luteimonas sp. 3794]|uniref:NAD(P)/FAD-dependent oxidoreductase n=1 Tax=Luteimonas sp. 3794 TaxID=2817730 RepID=UPI00286709CC|nr:FAD-dependent oxidoreductase [Luteimonas sp. 3794]MDR6992369.1 D-amino-acid dehydrogenase [Luteimonas sp. 3794]